MTQTLADCCCVCGARDARGLVDVVLLGGARATLCGSHATMHSRSLEHPRSEADLRELFRDRRGRRDRRAFGDDLGATLTHAFNAERRERDRRRA